MKPPAILCNHTHAGMVRHDLAEIECEADIIIKEPLMRNTAPAIALAVRHYQRTGDVLLILPCDHKIADVAALLDALETAYIATEQEGTVVLFGEPPQGPDTGYGYIQAIGDDRIRDIKYFHEKPDIETAASYIKSGCFWNTGIIIGGAVALARAFQKYAPEIWGLAEQIDPLDINKEKFVKMPDISMDFAILEKMKGLRLCPVKMGWADIGTLDRLRASA